MKKLIWIGVALLLSSFIYYNVCKEYNAYVKYIYDGDTITVDIDLGFGISKEDKIRLARINAPEMKGVERPDGIISRDALRELIDKKTIRFEDLGRGKYGRIIGEVYFGTINISDWLVANSYAEYRNYD